MYGEGNDYRTRCGAFVTGTGAQCVLDTDHDGPHRFVRSVEEIREHVADGWDITNPQARVLLEER